MSKNTALTELYCYENQLTSLNVSGCTALKLLVCYNNQLTKLDVSGCPRLVAQLQSAEGFVPDNGSTVIYGGYGKDVESEQIYLNVGLWVDLDTVLTPVPAQPPVLPEGEDVAIDATNFPDANFRAYVLENCDSNGDGTLSAAEIAAVTEINCYDMGIASLQGVEYFTALTYLNCGWNQLTELDMCANTALT